MELSKLEPLEPEKSIEVTFFFASPREIENNRIVIIFGGQNLGKWEKFGVMMDPLTYVEHYSLTLLINSVRCMHTSACQIFKFLGSLILVYHTQIERKKNILKRAW